MSNHIKVLVIDDDPIFREAMKFVLTSAGLSVLTASDAEEGRRILARNKNIQILLLDLFMPYPYNMGKELLVELRATPKYNTMPVIIITTDRDGTMETEMELLNKGADMFIVKPVDKEEIVSGIKELVARPQKQDYLPIGWTEVSYNSSDENDKLQGRSPKMVNIGREIRRITPTDSTVLITGEMGAGKELIAKTLHRYSRRKNGPFITVDCFGLPSYELIYSEIFGHEKELFPGTLPRRNGGITRAHEGTLFLNEVGILEYKMQNQLLYFLRNRKFYPLGSAEPHEADARVIAATRMNIEEAIKNGTFQEELYHYLGQEIINVPSLRERKAKTGNMIEGSEDPITSDDIEILVDYAIDRYNKTKNRKIMGIETMAIKILKEYDWPGNVRQLNNVINEAASKAIARRSENIVITEGDIKTSRLFRMSPDFEILLNSNLDNLYDKMMDGDQTDERQFAAIIEKILNIAEGDPQKAAEIGRVKSEATMEKYIAVAREINSRM